ncbi:MAG TPA: hypothetical protein VGK30_03300 [Candidatus Binatia bacterium]
MQTSLIALPLLVILGCGGGGGGGGHDTGPVATATATPVATPAPVPTAAVTLTLSSSIDLVGASFTVGYEAGRVTLLGSGAQAQCRLASNDLIAVNDDDAGTLRVALLPSDPLQRQTLALPTTLTCDFAENGGSITAGDVRVGSKTVAVLDGSGIAVAGDGSKLAAQ